MKRITPRESARVSDLASRLGSVEFRTLITGEGRRLIRPERLENLAAGRGRLSAEERERLQTVSTNANAIRNLSQKNTGKQRYKVNRAIRTWLETGKAKGVSYTEQDDDIRKSQMGAIKALRYLGIDPSSGTYYVRRR